MNREMMLEVYKEDYKTYELGEKTFTELLDKTIEKFETTKKQINNATTLLQKKKAEKANREVKQEMERLQVLKNMMWKLRRDTLVKYAREYEALEETKK